MVQYLQFRILEFPLIQWSNVAGWTNGCTGHHSKCLGIVGMEKHEILRASWTGQHWPAPIKTPNSRLSSVISGSWSHHLEMLKWFMLYQGVAWWPNAAWFFYHLICHLMAIWTSRFWQIHQSARLRWLGKPRLEMPEAYTSSVDAVLGCGAGVSLYFALT